MHPKRLCCNLDYPARCLPNLRARDVEAASSDGWRKPKRVSFGTGRRPGVVACPNRGRWMDKALPLLWLKPATSERSVWLARMAGKERPWRQGWVGGARDDVERPARARFRDLASAFRGDRTAQALASQRARPRRLCPAQTPRRQKPFFYMRRADYYASFLSGSENLHFWTKILQRPRLGSRPATVHSLTIWNRASPPAK